MAQIFSIQPNPHWVIIDNFSKLPNGAAIYTYRSLNPTEFKPAFQDAGGTIPYGQPIVGFGNGTMPPIFWEFDDTAPDETYYIRVYDAPITQGGVFLWDFNGLSGESGGGGGTIITNNDVQNLIINGQFYRNVGDQIGAPSLPTTITLAPSSHQAIGGYENSVNDGPPSPDIIFAKNNTSDSDSLTFVPVSPIGSNNLGANPTPEIFVKYNCTVGGAGLTYKYVQFPIVKGLQNLSGATVSVQIYARLLAGSTTGVTLNFRQFFGNGGSPSADVLTPIGGGPINLSLGSWSKIVINSQVIPSIAGKTLGSCGNDALYFQITFPLTDPIDVEFILPAIYLGPMTSNFDFHTLDEVSAVIEAPRTGDIRTTVNAFSPYGWVKMNDGTIGNPSSNATARANIDTFHLFDLLWTSFVTVQAFAPMFTSGGTPVLYGASSVADFTANRQLGLTRSAGRVMASALPIGSTQAFVRAANTLVVSSTDSYYTGMAVQVSGGSLPAPLLAGPVYFVIKLSATTISLAATTGDAFVPTPIVLTTAGSGTVTAVYDERLGNFVGEEQHYQSGAEVGVHNHPANFTYQAQSCGAGGTPVIGSDNGASIQTVNVGNSADNVSMGLMQPTVYMNVFIKL